MISKFPELSLQLQTTAEHFHYDQYVTYDPSLTAAYGVRCAPHIHSFKQTTKKILERRKLQLKTRNNILLCNEKSTNMLLQGPT